MRISGLASGFDTDAMVKNMMAIERMKVDRFEKSKQLALWKQESYNTMNKAFANFILNTQKDMGLKKTGSTGIITNSSYKNVDYVKKATSSNEAAATVTSTSKAVNGSFSIKVNKLAEEAKGSTYAAQINNDTDFGKEFSFEINGTPIKVTGTPIEGGGNKPVTMDQIVKVINENEDVGVSASYDKKSGTFIMQSIEKGEVAAISLTGFTKDGFASEDLFKGHATPGKEAIQAEIEFNGVTLKYDSNKFELNGVNIEIKSETTEPISINVSTNTESMIEKIEKLVKDYNDLVHLASLSVNEKAYPGYQPLTAEERKAMSESDVKLWDEKAKSGLLNRDETIQRTLQSIRNDLYRTVEGVEGFNHITQIGITTEKYSRGSAGGKLTIDTEKLKAAIEENPDAVMDLLFKEGDKKPYSESKPNEKDYEGDPEGYNAALKTYEEGLRAHEKMDNANRKANNGIFTNVYENLITGMQAIIDKSGPGQDSDLLRGVKSNILIDFVTKKSSISDLDKTVQEMNRQMDNLNILLAKKEDSYYAKFTAMEKAMHKMNGQSGWLAQQFG